MGQQLSSLLMNPMKGELEGGGCCSSLSGNCKDSFHKAFCSLPSRTHFKYSPRNTLCACSEDPLCCLFPRMMIIRNTQKNSRTGSSREPMATLHLRVPLSQQSSVRKHVLTSQQPQGILLEQPAPAFCPVNSQNQHICQHLDLLISKDTRVPGAQPSVTSINEPWRTQSLLVMSFNVFTFGKHV